MAFRKSKTQPQSEETQPTGLVRTSMRFDDRATTEDRAKYGTDYQGSRGGWLKKGGK
ncbi:hypothetical protein OG897_40705 [Streptomyces sp. NBC_00237]|uniref:hypothetical protein n=1 Tax=Streptomyces sp. NBC_00237 TaxID=2975687 RepID=UPI002258E2CA|nr:hypothetical protein [Streptomyces sp. NBC_00237]MCX5207706.1 hypothetical protein [Streptomyces sp. NBC_00237]